ncbi:ATP-binding protein [Pseudonocardia saturnea]|nr:ATP-binding protein [Pseudonocardia sp.]
MLIGRNGELNRAASRVGAATRGHGGLLLVSGEQGVGKSTLVAAAFWP